MLQARVGFQPSEATKKSVRSGRVIAWRSSQGTWWISTSRSVHRARSRSRYVFRRRTSRSSALSPRSAAWDIPRWRERSSRDGLRVRGARPNGQVARRLGDQPDSVRCGHADCHRRWHPEGDDASLQGGCGGTSRCHSKTPWQPPVATTSKVRVVTVLVTTLKAETRVRIPLMG